MSTLKSRLERLESVIRPTQPGEPTREGLEKSIMQKMIAACGDTPVLTPPPGYDEAEALRRLRADIKERIARF
jgi:hypothetical protein